MRLLTKILFIITAIGLQSCTQIDDYMLGKDNTPAPSPLAPLESTLHIKEKWSVFSGKANKTSGYLKLKPVVRGNMLYSASALGVVQALDKQSGKIIWSTQLKNHLASGPSVGSGYIAVGTDSSSVVVLDQKSGRELHEFKVSGDVISKPLIASGKVIAKTIDGNVYAFGLASGKKEWLSEHGSPSLILKAGSSPVLLGNVVLVGFSDGKLDALDSETGAVLWQRGIAYSTGFSDVERLVDIDADPIVRGQTVYLVSYQGYVGAMSLTDGQFIWQKPASAYKNMAMNASTLYLTDANDILWAFDAQTGIVKWKQVSFKARGLTEPVLMGNRIFIGDKGGYLHVLNTQNGELLSRVNVNSPIEIAPAVAGNKIYVMTANGKINCFSVS